MNTEFVIREWAAWAPGLAEPGAWQAWAAEAAPACPAAGGDEAPALGALAPLVRRRFNPLGRLAAQVVCTLDGATAPATPAPMVFASRYGDAGRSLALLAELAREEPVSPTAFGLSVHNAIGALVSIARGDPAPHTALAAGASSAGAAVIEAAGLLAEGAESVLVVSYDAPLPGDYAAFADEPPARFAWAWRVARPLSGEPRLALALRPARGDEADAEAGDAGLPFALGLLHFALGSATAWSRVADGQHWHWTRRDG